MNLFTHIFSKLMLPIKLILIAVFIYPFILSFSSIPAFGAEVVDNTAKLGDVKKDEKKTKHNLQRVKEIGGEVVIDGSMRVLEPIMGKVFDLVEISTPVTPATNHARIFLRADGTKQTLVIIYDDGTTDNIATNQ